MSGVHTIIAALDNSAAAKPVVATALALAPVLGARVEAVHVAEGEGHTARACAESLNVPYRAVAGDPLGRLADLAEAADVVAVVMGARSRPGGRRPAGHLSIGLAGITDKPVVVVPPEARPPAVLHSVLLAVEGSPRHARSLKRAVELAAAADLHLTVVHVDDEASIPSFSDQVQHETDAYAKEFLARYCRGAPAARLELRIGDPADQILDVADAVAPELIAVGWPQTPDAERGLVAKAVLNRSRVPVLLVATT